MQKNNPVYFAVPTRSAWSNDAFVKYRPYHSGGSYGFASPADSENEV